MYCKKEIIIYFCIITISASNIYMPMIRLYVFLLDFLIPFLCDPDLQCVKILFLCMFRFYFLFGDKLHITYFHNKIVSMQLYFYTISIYFWEKQNNNSFFISKICPKNSGIPGSNPLSLPHVMHGNEHIQNIMHRDV